VNSLHRVLAFLVIAIGLIAAVNPPHQLLPVKIGHEKGSFEGQISLSLTGSMNKAKLNWNANIRNTSDHQIFRVTFCVRAFDAADAQIQPGGADCILTLWGTNWSPGAPLNFKGNQNIRIADAKVPAAASRYTIEAIEVFDHAPNLRNLPVRCALVWPSAIRVFADREFRPTVLDKDSFTATYAYDGGRIDGYGDARQMLKAFTTANTALMGPTWDSFRIDAASLYLREDNPGTCTAEVKMTFAGFGKPMFGNKGWYAVDSNFAFEKSILDEVEAQSKQAGAADLDRAISQLPTEPPKPAESLAPPHLTLTSEPDGAEIEIDGEFIGNTPTTLTVKPGKVTVKMRKTGFQPWQRTLTLNPGDKRTLNGDLEK
jgi:hypothetical protein